MIVVLCACRFGEECVCVCVNGWVGECVGGCEWVSGEVG